MQRLEVSGAVRLLYMSLGVKGLNPLKVGLIGFPETSVMNYHYMLRNLPEERRSHLQSGGSLKSRPCLSLGTETYGQTCGRKDVYCK